jgi:hypothetical protein
MQISANILKVFIFHILGLGNKKYIPYGKRGRVIPKGI